MHFDYLAIERFPFLLRNETLVGINDLFLVILVKIEKSFAIFTICWMIASSLEAGVSSFFQQFCFYVCQVMLAND